MWQALSRITAFPYADLGRGAPQGAGAVAGIQPKKGSRHAL